MLQLTEQVAPFELSDKLKRLGCPQDSYFYWCSNSTFDEKYKEKRIYFISTTKEIEQKRNELMKKPSPKLGEFSHKECSAYTCAELDKMLPSGIFGEDDIEYRLFIQRTLRWSVFYVYFKEPEGMWDFYWHGNTKWEFLKDKRNPQDDDNKLMCHGSLPEAMAKMLVALLENQYIRADELF